MASQLQRLTQMRTDWPTRNPIVANLFNPAFCGEVIRIVISSYYKASRSSMPFAYVFLALPVLLHEKTRNRMPKTSNSYLFAWVEKNEDVFYDFPDRAKDMVPYTQEGVMYLMQRGFVKLDSQGGFEVVRVRKANLKGSDLEEYDMIMKKASILGKLLANSSSVNSVFSFFRITP